MTQEEKAKAYDEALGKVRTLYEQAKKKEDCPIWSTYEYIFPELAESEDERVREEIVKHFAEVIDNITSEEEISHESKVLAGKMRKWITWLEKQKEQKPTEIDEDIELGLDRALQIIKEAKGVLKGYQSDDGIYECDHAIRTLTYILKNGMEQKPDDNQFPPLEGLDAIKAQYYDRGFKNGFDEGVDSVKPAEWSEEDESKKERLISIVKRALHGNKYPILNDDGATELITWLKSRSHWKPSEEQIEALEHFIRSWGESGTMSPQNPILCAAKSLLIDLKKL